MSDPVITRFYVHPNYAGGFQFAWEVNPGYAKGKDWQFTVQLGETDTGPWKTISPVLKNQYVWRAPPALVAVTKEEVLFFQVEMNVDGVIHDSTTITPYGLLGRREFLMEQEIMRKEVLMAQSMSGIEGFVWIKSVFGPYCDHCRDFASGNIQDGQCPYCYGTGRLPGYHGPYGIWLVFAPIQHSKQMGTDNTEMKEVWTATVRVIGAIDMKKDDIVVDTRTDKRYYVDEHQHIAEVRRVTVVQDLSVREIPISEAVYKLGAKL